MDRSHFLAGQLLLAMPAMDDPRFAHAVIALCAHDEKGALGIGIGHEVEGVGLHALYGQLGLDIGCAPDVPIHYGGPVEPQRGFVLHSQDWHDSAALMVGDRWGLSATLDVLRAIAEGRGPARWLVAMGYAGWAPGQLDDEMSGTGWFATPGSDALLFEMPAKARWAAAYALAGVDVGLLSGQGGHA